MSTQKQIWTLITPQQAFEECGEVWISGDEHHYAAHVLRLSVGDVVELTNCKGGKATGIIQKISKKDLLISIEKVEHGHERQPRIKLWLAMPKPSTLEEVVATASELGVSEIHVFKSDKCAVKSELKKEKLQRISDEAVRISKSAFSAKIFEQPGLNSLSAFSVDSAVTLFCDESHVYENKITNSLFQVLQEKAHLNIQNIHILVGPEASFSDQERQFILETLHATPVSLGWNILRVPTAVTVAVGVVKNFFCVNFSS